MRRISAPSISLLSRLCATAALVSVPGMAVAETGLEDIIVTAQKRAENIQDLPISIAVLGEAALDQQGIANFQDLIGGAIPALRVAPLAGRTSALSVTMRGIGSGDATQISRDSAVGIYIDGIYLGRVQGLGTELFDLERIEVLRGPQGTLFGRNAVGGAINIISKRPTGELGGEIDMGAGNFDSRHLTARLNLPEIAGIRIKLDGLIARRGGLVDNPMQGAWDWGEYRRHGFRVQALARPAEGVELLYSFDVSRDKASQIYMQIEGPVPSRVAALPPIFSFEPSRVKRARLGVPLDPSVAKVSGHSFTASWQVSDAIILRSITAYRELSQTQEDNDIGHQVGFRPNGTFARNSRARVDQDQFSQELQLVGSTPSLKYVLGAYLFDEDASDSAYAPFLYRWNAAGTAFTVNSPPVGGLPPDRSSSNTVRSRALFGQATWTPPMLSDRLHLTAGARYTHDRKYGDIELLRGLPSPLAYRFKSSRVDPMASIGLDLSDNVNAYVRYGIAYRAGGASSRSPTFRSFGEEEVRSWEAGLKSELWDRRVRLNVAAYTMDYRDLQIIFPNPSNPSETETMNTDQPARIRGIEADVTVSPAPGLTLNGSYSYTDTRFPPQLNPITGTVQLVGAAFTPKHAATVAIDYEVPLSEMALRFHGDMNYSSRFLTQASSPVESDSYALFNARITLADIKLGSLAGVSLSAWGKNLTNKSFQTFRFDFAGTGLTNGRVAALNDPRTYGVQLAVKF